MKLTKQEQIAYAMVALCEIRKINRILEECFSRLNYKNK
jgi:hypothetical protein